MKISVHDDDDVGNPVILPDDEPDDTIGTVVVPFYDISADVAFTDALPFTFTEIPSASVTISYRLLCSENYYGDCSVFCEARDDDSGHYTCDAQGNIMCNDGYQGNDTNCTTRKSNVYDSKVDLFSLQ